MRRPTRSLRITTAALATVVIAVSGCKERKREPVPGPQSQPQVSQRTPAPASDGRHVQSTQKSVHMPIGASGISWFQGTIEEAFSRGCTG